MLQKINYRTSFKSEHNSLDHSQEYSQEGDVFKGYESFGDSLWLIACSPVLFFSGTVAITGVTCGFSPYGLVLIPCCTGRAKLQEDR